MVVLIFPMFAMVVLTFIIGGIAVKARFTSVTSGAVRLRYYKLMQGDDAPEFVIKTTRCFNNQFEAPVLFYVVCTLYVSLGIESVVGVAFAWAFVLLRAAHAYVHLSYNRVVHRMVVYWAALMCVVVLWINLIIHQM